MTSKEKRSHRPVIASLVVVMIAMLLGGCSAGKHTIKNDGYAQGKEQSIVILFENDVHCGIDGYAKMVGLGDAISDTAQVTYVSCGDFIQGGTTGAISHGQYIIDIMKHIPYAAVTLGNHEFDYQVWRMKELLEQLPTTVTCVNFTDMEGKRYYAPYVMKQMGNRKVAFVGVVTPTTISSEEYAFFNTEGQQLYDLQAPRMVELVQQSVDEARKEGADYVVVLSHLGESPNDLDSDSRTLLSKTTDIDALLDGHTHSVIPHDIVLNKEGKPIVAAQTGTKFQNVGKLVIMPDGKMSTELIPTSEITMENAEVKAATDSILNLSHDLTSRPVFTSDVDLRILEDDGVTQAVRLHETNAGDIVTDAYRITTGADFAITNGGGIRTEIKAGDLTYGDMVALLPYDNYVSIVELTGRELRDLLDACTSSLPFTSGDFPQVSGIKFTVDTKAQERIQDLMVLNKQTNDYEPINLDKTYQLATIDYCITGGGLQGKLKKNKVVKSSIIIYNECLINYVTDYLDAHITKEYEKPQGRITIR